MRSNIRVKLSVLILLLFTAAVNAQQKPNFIVILVDDLGFGDIGAYRDLYTGGDEKSIAYLHTPELDDLAREGIMCTRAYSASWCAPTRQMILSGCWINRKGVCDQGFPWLGRRLRQEGYTTEQNRRCDGCLHTTGIKGVENSTLSQESHIRPSHYPYIY